MEHYKAITLYNDYAAQRTTPSEANQSYRKIVVPVARTPPRLLYNSSN